MKDPWRVVDLLKPPAPARPDDKPARIDIKDKDFDADLRPHRACVLRFRSCAIEVCTPDIQTPRDALETLAKCILELKRTKAAHNLRWYDDVYAKWGREMRGAPPGSLECSRLECDDVVVWFAGQSLDKGSLALARALIKTQRNEDLSPILRRHGITPMLRTS